jgi:hypothetical protein
VTYLDHPDGPRPNLGIPPIDTDTVNLSCAASDCNFAGDVEAAVFFLGIDPQRGRVFEYLWTCPFCEMEQKDEQDDTDRLDA